MAQRKKPKKKKRTHGYGSKKKHRGGGSKGGKGYGGSSKHKYSYILKHKPDHFGKQGFFSRRKGQKTINVSELAKFGKKDIALGALGYQKLLGRGEVTEPFNVKIKTASQKAKKKIEHAGGKVIEG